MSPSSIPLNINPSSMESMPRLTFSVSEERNKIYLVTSLICYLMMKGENRGRKANFFSFCGDEIRLYLGKKSNCSADNTISN